MSPLIGVSSYHRDGELPAFSLPCGYIDALRAAGAVPIVLPPGEAEPARLLDHLDGLLLAGGGDLDPAIYGGPSHETIYMLSPERDSFELALTHAALKRPDLPVLAICRGAQVLNVALGGTLHSHLPDVFGDVVAHRLPPRLPTRHGVRIATGSKLGGILACERTDVCSWHHQAVDRLGSDLTAVAWSDDGVVEAIEHREHPWCIAVQWHPEMQHEEAVPQRVFRAFADAARSRMRS